METVQRVLPDFASFAEGGEEVGGRSVGENGERVEGEVPRFAGGDALVGGGEFFLKDEFPQDEPLTVCWCEALGMG